MDAIRENNFKNDSLLANSNSKENEEMPIKLKSASIRRRPNGSWEVRYYLNHHRYSVYAKTQKQAIEKYKQDLKDRQQQFVNSDTLEDWLNQWYQLYKVNRLKQTSLDSIQSTMKNHILPTIGDRKLGNITSLQLQVFINSIEKNRTREVVAGILKDALRRAHLNKLIKENPFLSVSTKKVAPPKRQALTIQQQNDFLKAIEGHHLEELFKFYLLTGVRRSEALLIRWKDINEETGLMAVNGTKTKASIRYLPLTEELKSLLTQLKDSKKYSGELLFPIKGNFPTRRFNAIANSFGWEHITLHSLRHTFATRCLESGVPMKVVQYWLGHSTITTTSDIYSHITQSFSKEEMAKVKIL